MPGLERQAANLRRALRTARPNAAKRIPLEIDEIAAGLRQATAQLVKLERVQERITLTKKSVQQTMMK